MTGKEIVEWYLDTSHPLAIKLNDLAAKIDEEVLRQKTLSYDQGYADGNDGGYQAGFNDGRDSSNP